MMDEFEKWLIKTYPGRFCYHHLTAANHMLIGWKAATETIKKLDEKDKELEALRGFAQECIDYNYFYIRNKQGFVYCYAKAYSLIDKDDNKTELLTGIKPDEH